MAKAKRLGKLHLIQGFRATLQGIVPVLVSKEAALELLARYHGLLGGKGETAADLDRTKQIVIPDEDDRPGTTEEG